MTFFFLSGLITIGVKYLNCLWQVKNLHEYTAFHELPVQVKFVARRSMKTDEGCLKEGRGRNVGGGVGGGVKVFTQLHMIIIEAI